MNAMSNEADFYSAKSEIELARHINLALLMCNGISDQNAGFDMITSLNDTGVAKIELIIQKIRAAAARDMRERAMSAVQDLRVRTAPNFVDANCRGQRGIDRCDALYDAYNAIRALPDTPGDQQP